MASRPMVAPRPIHDWRSDPWCSNPDLSIRWPQGALTPLLGLALALLVLAGCSPPGPDQDTPANSITDDRGRFHTIGPHRSRVISLVPAVTETLVAIGVGDRLVARTDFDRQPELDSLPVIQGALEPSLEVIVAMEPDLVIVWPAEGSQVSERLAELGVLTYASAVQTVDDFELLTRNMGQLMGVPARADSLAVAVRQQLDAVAAVVAGSPLVEVVYLVQEDPPMVAGPGGFLDSIIRTAGGVNAFHDVEGWWPLVSMEEVVRRDPDYIIAAVGGWGTSLTRSGPDPSLERLRRSPTWSVVPAVAAGRAISVDADLFSRAGPRLGEAARDLASRLH